MLKNFDMPLNTGHFCNESFQAINCTGTNNQTHNYRQKILHIISKWPATCRAGCYTPLLL